MLSPGDFLTYQLLLLTHKLLQLRRLTGPLYLYLSGCILYTLQVS